MSAVIRWKTALSCCLAKKRRYIHEPISVLTQDSYCCVGQVLESTDTATIVVLLAKQDLLAKRQSAESTLGSRSPSRDFLGLSAVVGFVVVGSVTGMPPRRISVTCGGIVLGISSSGCLVLHYLAQTANRLPEFECTKVM